MEDSILCHVYPCSYFHAMHSPKSCWPQPIPLCIQLNRKHKVIADCIAMTLCVNLANLDAAQNYGFCAFHKTFDDGPHIGSFIVFTVCVYTNKIVYIFLQQYSREVMARFLNIWTMTMVQLFGRVRVRIRVRVRCVFLWKIGV